MVGFCLFSAVDEQDKFTNIKDYDRFLKESLENATEFPKETVFSMPVMAQFAGMLFYNYDFGDDWNFVITAHYDVEYLKGRVSAAEIKEAMKSVLTLARPMVIAADGLPLIEDVGGPYGFMEFLKGEGMYEDREESLAWAKGNGWTGKIGNLKTLL